MKPSTTGSNPPAAKREETSPSKPSKPEATAVPKLDVPAGVTPSVPPVKETVYGAVEKTTGAVQGRDGEDRGRGSGRRREKTTETVDTTVGTVTGGGPVVQRRRREGPTVVDKVVGGVKEGVDRVTPDATGTLDPITGG